MEALQYAESEGRVAPEVRERYQLGTLENPLFPGLFERAAMTVGGSIQAAELALQGHVVFHPSGGTHHGRPDRASGFCYFNDPVFAIRTLLAAGIGTVAYVDLDAHHGDGVEDAFRADSRVTTAVGPRSGSLASLRRGQRAGEPGVQPARARGLQRQRARLPRGDRDRARHPGRRRDCLLLRRGLPWRAIRYRA